MDIFKFGGASVKDADGVKNVLHVLRTQGFKNCILVVSAMDKTTNALEQVVSLYFNNSDFNEKINEIRIKHYEIIQYSFKNVLPITNTIDTLFNDLRNFLNLNDSNDFNFVYDQVVSYGELISSKILSEFLNENGFTNTWLDARNYIKTDNHYREGIIDWETTNLNIQALSKHSCYVTQGFIGSDNTNFTTTLGREGSDYSAAIFAYCLDAKSVTIWKDVPGIMTGDPRKFDNVTLLSNISYEEAIEMAYYGASVIHPKTLQPLKQKQIPFYVKSFLKPEERGTAIGNNPLNQYIESYILKENQILMNISTKDFSFIAEDHMRLLFEKLNDNKIKVSLIQNSAISLALCLEDTFCNIDRLVEELSKKFIIDVNKKVSLFTVRNLEIKNLHRFYEGKKILLEQISRKTLQMVIH